MSVRLLIAFTVGCVLGRLADMLDAPVREWNRLLRRMKDNRGETE